MAGFHLTVRDGVVTARTAAGVLDRTRDGVRVLLIGHLHYRAELAAKSQESKQDDASLVVAAFHRHGLRALEWLQGEFSLALVDGASRRIVVSRDPMGAVPVFWRKDRSGFSIASDLHSLADASAPAPAYVADILLMASPNPDDLDSTPSQSIHRVLPGQLVEFDFDGTVHAKRSFDWHARISTNAGRRGDAPEQFREILVAAIRERCQGTLAAQVSGGMDSTAIALLAAGIAPPVRGLSLVYERIAELAGEQRYLDLLAHDGLDIARIAADDMLDYAAFATIGPHAEPSPWLFRAGQDLALCEAARAAGCTTVLTGIGADETLAVVPHEIADHLRHGSLMRAHAIASAWARAKGTGAWRFLRTFGFDQLLAPRSRWYANRLPRWRPPPWLNRDFVRSVDWADRSRSHARRFHGEGASALEAQLVANIRNAAGDWIGNEIARPMGLELSHPFRDPRVLAFGAASQLATPADPRQPKPLLSAAMRGIVPDAILDRRGKARFDAIHYMGLARHRDMLIEMIAQAPSGIDAFFDRRGLSAAIADAALGYRRLEEMHGLAASLAVVKWMSLHDKRSV